MIRCIGVVQQEESLTETTVITLFDVDGIPKRYQCSISIQDVCFDNHGIDGELLTPCFDDSGRHEHDTTDCFCGEDSLHFHAHLKTMCHKEESIAMTTLYEVLEHEEHDEATKSHHHHHIAVSPAMPNACCNSNGPSQNQQQQQPPENKPLINKNQRVFPNSVQHGDSHIDDLFLDECTGELRLRNSGCSTCDICWHGKFQWVASRNLAFGHFSIYTIPNESFIVTPQEEQLILQMIQPRRSVRSTIYCGGICCAAELPAVLEALQVVVGVDTYYVNIPLKQVNIDHDPDRISAHELLRRLSSVGGTSILTDGGAVTMCSVATATVQSKFTLDGPVADHQDLKQKCPLVQSFAIDQDSKTVTATHGPLTITASQIARQIGATVLHDGTKDLFPKTTDPASGNKSRQRFPRPTVIVSGILWIVSMLSFIGGTWSHLKWVALVSISFGIPPIAMRAFRTLQRWSFDTNCLMFFASIGAIGLQDFTEAAAVVFLFALSEWLELRATSRARTALLSIIQLRPDIAVVVVKEDLVTVPAAFVPVDTLVSVKAGDKIPCDGTVEEGTSLVDESSLTGESRPISKSPGSTVASGTLNCGVSPMTIRTTATTENSAVSRLIRLVEEAQGNRSAVEKVRLDQMASFRRRCSFLLTIDRASIVLRQCTRRLLY